MPGDAFQEEEIEVPVMREEAVVAKEAHVTGQVNLNKNVETETETVGGDVRQEDVVVDGEDQEFVTSRGRGIRGETTDYTTETTTTETTR